MRLLPRVLALALLLTVLAHASPAQAATRPSAPRAVTATPLDRAVKVAWARPASTGGSRITGYAVQRRNSTAVPWTTVRYVGPSARSWTETGLVNGRRFHYRVQARNAVGTGRASAQVSAVPRTVPGAVRYFEADNRDRALGAYWPAPASNGAAIVGYRVELSTDGATWSTARTTRLAATRASPLLFTGLAPGGRYWLRIRARNAAGYGPASGSGPYRVYTVPGAVGDLAASPGDGAVTLSWAPPAASASAGVPAAASYVVRVSADGGATWTTDSTAAQSPWVVDGLANGTSYRFEVRARSAYAGIGPGPASEIAPGAPSGPPSVPQALSLGWDEVASDYRLTWQPPANDGGQPLDRNEAEHWTTSTPPPRPVLTFGPGTTAATLADLALDHQVRLRACSAIGCGPWTEPVGPVTGPVTNLAATQAMAGTVRSVTVTWDPPANALATSYDVQRSSAGGPFTTLASGAGLTYVDGATAAETDYVYRVVPSGGGGAGAPRTTTITTTADQALSLSPATVAVTEGSTSLAQVLLAVPTSVDTVVTLATADPGAAQTSTGTVTVPAGGTSASVTVQGTPDDDLAPATTTLTATLGTLSSSASVTVADDDSQAVLAPASVTVADGETVPVDVRLAFRPAGPVTVTVGVTQSGNRVAVAPGTLVFSPDDGDVAQQVQVTGLAAGSATLTLTAAGAAPASTQVTVTP